MTYRPASGALSTVAGLLLIGLSACAAGPDYRRPDPVLPTAFHTASPFAAASPDAAGPWWGGFDDPLLSRAVERSTAGNLDVAQAAARLTQSRAALRAATSQLLPMAEGRASAAKVEQSLDGPIGEIGRRLPGYRRNVDDYALSLGASWEIDLFGGLRRRREAAAASTQAAAAELTAARLAVQADTADAYIQVRELQARIQAAQAREQVQSDLLGLIDRRVREGVSPDRERRQTRAALEAVRATIPPLRAALAAQLDRLDILAGEAPGARLAEYAAPGPVPHPPTFAPRLRPGDLLRRRPDLAAAERRLKAANARIGAAVAEYYPRVLLTAAGGVDSLAAASLFSRDAQTGQLAAGLSWRVLDLGQIAAGVAQARGQEAEALAAYRAAALKAAGEVEAGFARLNEARIRTQALDRQILELTAARRQAQLAYENGASSLLEVRDIDRDLLTATDLRVQAQSEAARAAVAAIRALGGGWAGG